ncbi:unnamed protein product [Caretta caretta]
MENFLDLTFVEKRLNMNTKGSKSKRKELFGLAAVTGSPGLVGKPMHGRPAQISSSGC